MATLYPAPAEAPGDALQHPVRGHPLERREVPPANVPLLPRGGRARHPGKA